MLNKNNLELEGIHTKKTVFDYPYWYGYEGNKKILPDLSGRIEMFFVAT